MRLAKPSLIRVSILVLLLVTLPLVSLPVAADALQPVRALIASAAILLALSLPELRMVGTRGRLAGIMILLAAGLYAVSAVTNGIAPSIWGVHGRFQGAVSALVVVAALAAGYLSLGSRIRTVHRALVVVTALVAAIIVVQRTMSLEPAATMGNQVLAGSWLAIATVCCAALYLVEAGPRKHLTAAAVILGVVGVGLTSSRGALVALAVGLAFVFFAGRRTLDRRHAAAALVLAVLAAGLMAAQGVARFSAADLAGGSAGARLELLRSTASMVGDHPLLGVGPGRFLYAYPAYQSPRHVVLEGADIRADQAHGIPFHAAAEVGLPYALLLAAGLASVLWIAMRSARAGDGASLLAGAGVAAFAGHALFGISTIETDVLVAVLAGVVLARADGQPDAATRSGRFEFAAFRLGAAGLSALALLAVAYYLNADMHYRQGVAEFEAARFDAADARLREAIRLDPLVDVYRVGLADLEQTRSAAGRTAEAASVVAVLDEGLRLEPQDHDLALAKARVLRFSKAEPSRVLEAYTRAVGLFPLGQTAVTEAMQAAAAAGDFGSAQRWAESLKPVSAAQPRPKAQGAAR